MKLYTRLLLLFLLVAVLPLALLGYLNLQDDQETLRQQALERMSGLADKKVNQVEDYLAERVQDVRMLAHSPQVMKEMSVMAAAYGDRAGARYAAEDKLTRQYFRRYVDEAGWFYDIFLITTDGEIVYTQKHEADFATNLITGAYRDSQLALAFQTTRMTLEHRISGYEQYAPSQTSALFITVPVMAGGRFIGVLAVQLDKKLFYQVATDATGLGVSGEAEFGQRDGDSVLFTTPLKYRAAAAMNLRMASSEIRNSPMISSLYGTSGAGVKPDYRGKQVVAAWRYLPELDWGMVVKMDADEVFASINQQRITMLETLLRLLLFIALVAYYFGRQITVPLQNMALTADEVARGNLDKQVDESAPGELGLFAQAFNRMSQNLRELYRSLDERIEERTRDLNVSNEQLQQEIIEREYIEAALRDSQQDLSRSLDDLRYQKFVLDQHAMVATTDINGSITYANEKFCALTGYTAEELLGQNHRILNSGTHPAEFFAQMYRTIRAGLVWNGEICNRAKDGSLHWLMTTIVPFLDQAGRLSQYITVSSDISDRKRIEEENRSLAFYDALTGLPNRRLLQDRIGLALSASVRSRQYGAVLFLDMDRFKTLNDTLGHDYGDMLLVEVAHRIRACVREVDTVARMGGDEFVVLIEKVDEHLEEASQKVAQIAEKIRASLAEVYRLNSHEYRSSPSIGVCLYLGTDKSVDTLLKQADIAMYRVKESGKNAVIFFDLQMQHVVKMHAELEADLRHAVADGQLRLYYQIQVDRAHRALGAEALVRWVHPVRGLVSPAQFIPVAEESSLILGIGDWVLETACRQLAAWRSNELTRHLTIAVNVSAQQFKLVDFVSRIDAALKTHGVDAGLLKLELTESVVLADVADVVAKMHALLALGVKLSLDDFGTGYSSLAYLKKLPIDQLKIDKSFIHDITTDSNDAVMVEAIIGMAQSFGLSVIAEGVETEGHLAFLMAHGCGTYQGYLFGKPVPIQEFEGLLDSLES